MVCSPTVVISLNIGEWREPRICGPMAAILAKVEEAQHQGYACQIVAIEPVDDWKSGT
jgi:hypothetical protein